MVLDKNVCVLAGGVGGAKLAYGLAKVLPAERLKIIVNTGDDFWHLGLRICPDLDTMMYTLAGLVDPVNGWGLEDDSTRMLSALEKYGRKPWFRLGDLDLATHLLRTEALHQGESLTDVTRQLSESLGIQVPIIPMCNEWVETKVDTIEEGELSFQAYFVKHRWQPTVKSLRFEGIQEASLSETVKACLAWAEILMIAPSNPWLSIDPILAIPTMHDTIRSRAIPRIAISPIIGDAAVKGPAAKLMKELHLDVSAQSVLEHYGDVINGFVYDDVDKGQVQSDIALRHFQTWMKDDQDKIDLAQNILQWIEGSLL